jgi:large subunit ribosomal protein L13
MQKKKNTTNLLSKEEAHPLRKWLILDASGKILGRFATEVAKILRGKHKTNFTPHIDLGDGVIVINADKIKVTGAKAARKLYRRYTGSMSGMREVPFNIMQTRNPEYIIRHAVKGMMPKTRLGEAQIKKLRIYAGDQHEMQAQTPISVNI